MFRKLTLAFAASAALGAAALSPPQPPRKAGMAATGGLGWGHYRGLGFGFSPAYVGPQYVDDGCYVTRRIRTARGIRLRTINVCY